jgi:hypothetical protein
MIIRKKGGWGDKKKNQRREDLQKGVQSDGIRIAIIYLYFSYDGYKSLLLWAN